MSQTPPPTPAEDPTAGSSGANGPAAASSGASSQSATPRAASPSPKVGEVAAWLATRYPAALAEDWDSNGLTCGDPAAPVRRILLAVDPNRAVADEAAAMQADLLITHHPLLLRGVRTVAADTAKGAVLHRLIGNRIALCNSHTPADSAEGGVADALADALVILWDREPLVPRGVQSVLKLTVHIPTDQAETMLDALAAAGAGRMGDYERCAYTVEGIGHFTPTAAANPTIGRPGVSETVGETRIEMVLPPSLRHAVETALLAVHPYEEPAYDFVALQPQTAHTGLGRIGRLAEPRSLWDLAHRLHGVLPWTAGGVRLLGEPTRMVERIAVCPGAGDSLIDVAAARGADVYITGDLRHHPVTEAVEALQAGGRDMAFLDVSHWASEWMWLPSLAREVRTRFPGVEVRVSTLPTDPWTAIVAK